MLREEEELEEEEKATYEELSLASKFELLWLADLRGRRGEARELVEVVMFWGGVMAKWSTRWMLSDEGPRLPRMSILQTQNKINK